MTRRTEAAADLDSTPESRRLRAWTQGEHNEGSLWLQVPWRHERKCAFAYLTRSLSNWEKSFIKNLLIYRGRISSAERNADPALLVRGPAWWRSKPRSVAVNYECTRRSADCARLTSHCARIRGAICEAHAKRTGPAACLTHNTTYGNTICSVRLFVCCSSPLPKISYWWNKLYQSRQIANYFSFVDILIEKNIYLVDRLLEFIRWCCYYQFCGSHFRLINCVVCSINYGTAQDLHISLVSFKLSHILLS